MFFQRVKTAGLGHNAYLMDCGGAQAVVVDPRRDVDEYLRLARENALSIAYVLQTHRQEDFEFGSRALADATGAQIVGGRHELIGDVDVRLADGDELRVGTSRFVLLETPGHTPESVCYATYVADAGERCWGVFSGDTLFVGDTGRTDLSDAQQTARNAGILYDSIHAKLAPLGDQALLFPAHGSGSACGGNISARDDSTLGVERATNAAFTKTRDEFIAHKVAEKMARPPYFVHMERVNLRGGRAMPSLARVAVLQPKQLQRNGSQGVIIDTREPDAFAGAHIPGSYNIWLGGLSAFASWIADAQTRIFLVVDDESRHAAQAVEALARIGLDRVDGVLAGGIANWREQGLPIDTLATAGAAEVGRWLRDGPLQVLDVRDEYEWHAKHIAQARHRFVGDLPHEPPDWRKDSRIVVHCSVGHRSGFAASILKRHGYGTAVNMLGGLAAWQELGLPLESPAPAG